jgi:hypothetical protein
MKDPIKRKKGTLLIASFFVMLFVGSFIYTPSYRGLSKTSGLSS